MAFILMVVCVLSSAMLTNAKIANYNHNLKLSDINDLDLPTTVLSKKEADIQHVSKTVSEYVALVMTIAETAEIAISVYKDFNDGTIHKTVETVGGYYGANAGAYFGASIGSFIFPGPGTAFGAFLGGIYGRFYGASTAREAAKIALNN